MFDMYLVPEKTVVTAKGTGEPVDIGAAGNRVILLVLNVSNVVEQESLDVTVFGSADGTDWSSKPLIAFPQKFYVEQQPMLLDLTGQLQVRYLRAQWDVNRWGRGPETARFEFSLRATEVAPELLR